MKVPDETTEAITLHGLGFLQVRLGGNQRLHVWHPDLPRRACFKASFIHDHSFGFSSRILVGTQQNVVYAAEAHEHGPWVSYLHEGPRTPFGNRPWLSDGRVNIRVVYQETIEAGGVYGMLAYVYHSTQPGGDGRVATLMKKSLQGPAGAHSLCHATVQPDVDFDRKQWPPARLWEVVVDVLGSAAVEVVA